MSGFQYSLIKDVYNIPEEEQQRIKPIKAVPFPPPIHTPYYYHYPTPTRLTRLHNALPPTKTDGMLPSLWWVFTYLGLAALTAIGIRSSSK